MALHYLILQRSLKFHVSIITVNFKVGVAFFPSSGEYLNIPGLVKLELVKLGK